MMSSKKKPGEKLIAVDVGKLSRGLKTTFEGVAMVFDSLGVDAGFEVADKEDPAEKKTAAKKAEKKPDPAGEKAAEPEEEEKDETEDAGTDSTGGIADTSDGSAGVAADDGEVDTPEAGEPQAETAESEASAPAITLDDVTKIIVQKMKQDRSNNQKIGQILKTHGVAKVGELDPKKYEAFLTDLAAL